MIKHTNDWCWLFSFSKDVDLLQALPGKVGEHCDVESSLCKKKGTCQVKLSDIRLTEIRCESYCESLKSSKVAVLCTCGVVVWASQRW